MNKPKLTGILVGVFLLFSCEEKTDWDFGTSEPYLVADCILTNENKIQEMKLYYSLAGMNQEPAGVTGAAVKVSNGTQSITFVEDTSVAGRYVSATPFMATAGNTYSLIIAYNGINDTATAEMTAINPLEPIVITEGDTLYKFVYATSNRPSMTEVFYDWSAVPSYSSFYGAPEAGEVFYSLDNLDVNKEFAPEKQVIEFPRNTKIIRRKYSLSDEHQEFIHSLLMETEWRGGFFDVEQGNVSTNFRHGVRGWFAACMVLADTTVFD